MVVLAFVIHVSVEKFKMRSMCFSFASSVLRSLNYVLYLGPFLFLGFLSLVLGLIEQLPLAFSSA